MAIASSVLQHMITEVRCKTLFVTHYPLIAEDLERQVSQQVANVHMGYVEDDESALDKSRRIHFLYTLSQGVSEGSFGIECARLAGLHSSILENAIMKKRCLEVDILRKNKATR
jgi:DNA mismatch repair protein MSH3